MYMDSLHSFPYIEPKVDINGCVLLTVGPAPGSRAQLMCGEMAGWKLLYSPVPKR